MKKLKLSRQGIIKNNLGERFYPLSKLFPSILTLAGLAFGISSIRFALDGKFELSIIMLLFASLIDGLDGRIARLLNATSKFGAELDSLADFASFGVSPMIVIYLFCLQDFPVQKFGWIVVIIFASCMAIRLARFNSSFPADKAKWMDKFFVGVPAPAGAMLSILPLMIYAEYGAIKIINPVSIAGYELLIAFLLVSRVPTFSVKKLVIKQEYVALLLMVMALIIAGLIIETWITLIVLSFIYSSSIVLSVLYYLKLKKESV